MHEVHEQGVTDASERKGGAQDITKARWDKGRGVQINVGEHEQRERLVQLCYGVLPAVAGLAPEPARS